jgi:hypothetical protein
MPWVPALHNEAAEVLRAWKRRREEETGTDRFESLPGWYGLSLCRGPGNFRSAHHESMRTVPHPLHGHRDIVMRWNTTLGNSVRWYSSLLIPLDPYIVLFSLCQCHNSKFWRRRGLRGGLPILKTYCVIWRYSSMPPGWPEAVCM